ARRGQLVLKTEVPILNIRQMVVSRFVVVDADSIRLRRTFVRKRPDETGEGILDETQNVFREPDGRVRRIDRYGAVESQRSPEAKAIRDGGRVVDTVAAAEPKLVGQHVGKDEIL